MKLLHVSNTEVLSNNNNNTEVVSQYVNNTEVTSKFVIKITKLYR